VAVKRIKPNILSEHFDESRSFYTGVIGLEEGDGLDWILFFGTDQREVQLSVMALDIKARIHPDISIEVDDVDDVHRRAVAAGAEVVPPGAWAGVAGVPQAAKTSRQKMPNATIRHTNDRWVI
jgi:catechol 2,3-dioxygenase-like lactoylglutathione lyase family enzyme